MIKHQRRIVPAQDRINPVFFGEAPDAWRDTRPEPPGRVRSFFTPVTTLRDRCIPDTGFVIWRSPISPMTWDELGKNGIERMAAKSNGWVYYLGGLAKYQDRYDMLKPVVKGISRFSLKHL